MNVNRREFIAALAALTACGGSLDLLAEAMPAYYEAYLVGIAARLRANAAKGTPNAFWFVTDLHFAANHKMAGRVIADLIGRTGIKNAFGGGDYQVAFCGKKEPKAAVEATIGWIRALLRDPIEAAGGVFLTAKGNHDTRITVGLNDKRGYTLSAKETRGVLMDVKAAKSVVMNRDDDIGMYYHYDDPVAKVRYIFSDTSDGPKTGHNDTAGVSYGNVMSERQVVWIRDVALGTLPVGWKAVALQHIPFCAVLGGNKSDEKRMASIRAVYEKAVKDGKLLFDVSGHHHCDRFAVWNGLVHLGVTCDACYFDPVKRSPFSNMKTMAKQKGTPSEQGFDCIQFGDGLLRATRVGAGHDRTIHLKTLSMRADETLKLVPTELKGKLSWSVFDSAVFAENKSGGNWDEFCVFSRKCADVALDGTVTAKRPGSVTAVAWDAAFNKEIFGIEIS